MLSSQNESTLTDKAWWVNNMNLYDGGAQPVIMQKVMWNGKVQKMQLDDGTPKGMKTVLMERGLWIPELRKICADCKQHQSPADNAKCCAHRILSDSENVSKQPTKVLKMSRLDDLTTCCVCLEDFNKGRLVYP